MTHFGRGLKKTFTVAICKNFPFRNKTLKNRIMLGMMAYAFNPSIWEVEVERQGVGGHSQLHFKFKSSLSYFRPCHELSTETKQKT